MNTHQLHQLPVFIREGFWGYIKFERATVPADTTPGLTKSNGQKCFDEYFFFTINIVLLCATINHQSNMGWLTTAIFEVKSSGVMFRPKSK